MTLARRGLARAAPIATMALIVAAGCSGRHDGTQPDRARRGSPATAAAATCPAPSPVPSARVPRILVTHVGGDDWYGSGPLWTQGIGAGMIRQEHGFRLKYGSFTLDDQGAMSDRPGRPRLTVRQVDGPGTGRSSVGGYADATGRGNAPISFWPTVLTLPHSGCWQITESLPGTALRFQIHAP